MNRILRVYEILFRAFGAQGWWPLTGCNASLVAGGKDFLDYRKVFPFGEERDFLLHWPRHCGVLPEKSEQKFEIVAGALLTQNTSWLGASKAVFLLSKKRLLDVESVVEEDLRVLEECVKPAGFFRQKASRLKGLGKYFVENYGGDLNEFFSQPTGALRFELLSLNGVGEETADSILLYAGNKASFVVDAYTKRIFSRFGLLAGEESYGVVKEFFENSLPRDSGLFKEYHALLVELAKSRCLKRRPVCGKCVLVSECRFWQGR